MVKDKDKSIQGSANSHNKPQGQTQKASERKFIWIGMNQNGFKTNQKSILKDNREANNNNYLKINTISKEG